MRPQELHWAQVHAPEMYEPVGQAAHGMQTPLLPLVEVAPLQVHCATLVEPGGLVEKRP